jgi:hypothetical protein
VPWATKALEGGRWSWKKCIVFLLLPLSPKSNLLTFFLGSDGIQYNTGSFLSTRVGIQESLFAVTPHCLCFHDGLGFICKLSIRYDEANANLPSPKSFQFFVNAACAPPRMYTSVVISTPLVEASRYCKHRQS